MVNIIFLLITFLQPHTEPLDKRYWGFYGHRIINRLAVFTLPEDLMRFYKNNILYLETHAIDPDKRRYAIKAEAVRHYFDLDHWTHRVPKDSISRDYPAAILKFDQLLFVTSEGSFPIFTDHPHWQYLQNDSIKFSLECIDKLLPLQHSISGKSFLRWFQNSILPHYDPVNWNVPLSECSLFNLEKVKSLYLFIPDSFSKHGILPFHIQRVYSQLVQAFKLHECTKVLKLSAELGHYLADAHVPLHTTSNYNGQLTQQNGIHSFWESRLPELFAETDFDFVVGAAQYIDNIQEFTWQIIFASHQHVNTLLESEKLISQTYPFDKQYCYEKRGTTLVKTPCRKYAEAYYKSLKGQVEERMRSSILNLGSYWMSAWMEAGQPEMPYLERTIDDKDSIEIDIQNTSLLKLLRPHE